jgi:hypothetical protein
MQPLTPRRVRGAAPALAALATLACGGGDLTLPGDGAPARLVAVSGSDQRAPAGTRLDAPLVVVVVDSADRPVPDVRVVFRFAGDVDGAGVTPERASTGDDGRVEAQAVLGVVPGEQLVEAALEGTDDPDLMTVFALTALRPSTPGNEGGGGGGDRNDEGEDRNDGNDGNDGNDREDDGNDRDDDGDEEDDDDDRDDD